MNPLIFSELLRDWLNKDEEDNDNICPICGMHIARSSHDKYAHMVECVREKEHGEEELEKMEEESNELDRRYKLMLEKEA